MISTLLTAAISLSSLSFAASVPNKRADGTLRLAIAATPFNVLDFLSQKRQTVATVENVQTGTRYIVDFQIGTPPQSVSVALDTGSSNTWVNPTCSAAGSSTSISLCNSYPKYVNTTSSSAVDLGQSDVLGYGKGSATVEYLTDDFVVGGSTVKAQKFGVATSSTDMPIGLMGVGPGHELVGYNTIVDELAIQGVTKSRAFSLDLRNVDSPDGAIIFGGIDTMKYSGSLEKMPIIPAAQSPDKFNRYWINMKSIGITKPGEAPKKYAALASPGQPVFLDSGGTLSRLPTAIFNEILADFPGAQQDGSSGLYTVDCSLASAKGTVDFGFGNTVINVPYSEFIWHIQGLCYFGIAVDDASPVLGDTFLRAAYVVYDQDNQNVLLANAANCGTNLVPIGKGPDAVPSIVGACPASSTSSAGTSSSSSSSSSSTAVSTSSSTSSSVESVITPTSSKSSSATVSSKESSLTIQTSTSTPSSSSSIKTSSSLASVSIPDYTPTSYGVSSSAAVSASVGLTVYPTALPNEPIRYQTTSVSSATDSSTSSVAKYTTSTVCTTTTYTNEAGHKTTEVISLYTSVCPVTETKPTATAYATPSAPKPTVYSVSTVYTTTTYVASGQTVTDTVSLYTTLCPVEETKTPESPATTPVYPATTPESPATAPVYPVTTPESPATTSEYISTTTYYSTSTSTSTITQYPVASIQTTFTAKYVESSGIVKPIVANSTAIVYPVAPSTGTGAVYPTSTSVPYTGAASGKGAGNLVLVGLAVVGGLFLM